ncbi:hypothetical protein C8Q76DRAFT_473288 [Earliella scabrosa]|nr:hypothetical protein C8Q76DRAFT_473288 [Earliella scabrosa]
MSEWSITRKMDIHYYDLQSRSASVTIDILRDYYGQLSDDRYLHNPSLLDTPQNAFLLNHHLQDEFHEFSWCLHPTEISNRYVVKVYNHQATHLFVYGLPEDLEIAFKDHSDEIPIHEKSGKRVHIAVSVDLPDPELLRLHAALAGVFHLSGAVDVFPLIARRADGDAFMQSIVEPQAISCNNLWRRCSLRVRPIDRTIEQCLLIL